jgi:cell wall assembly regulator SMI1
MPKRSNLLSYPTARSEPFSVPAAPTRLTAWLGAHLPKTLKSLRPGAKRTEIRAVEKAIGRALPADVVESYCLHDGQSYSRAPGLVYGLELLPLRECLRVWRGRRSREEQSRAEGSDPARFDENCSSFPDKAVQTRYTCNAWFPLCDDEAGNHFGIDLEPGPAGTLGQVINFGRDEEKHCVLAWSWSQFLTDLADELEAGNHGVEPGNQWEGPRFDLLEPKVNHFLQASMPWSRAKLGQRRLSGADAQLWRKAGWRRT